MIIGIGIDQVATERFLGWTDGYSQQLDKVFTPAEIAYCTQTSNELQRAQRLAVRFAAREAFYKAYAAAMHNHYRKPALSFVQVMRHVAVMRTESGIPSLYVDWQQLAPDLKQYPTVQISLSHTDDLGAAIVILQE